MEQDELIQFIEKIWKRKDKQQQRLIDLQQRTKHLLEITLALMLMNLVLLMVSVFG